MILTVTLNPLVERRLFFDSIAPGKSNRSKKEIIIAGGKGINVSRQLNMLGLQNSALTFLGGNNGKIIRHMLAQDQISFSFVPIKNETRYSIFTIDESSMRMTNYFAPDTEITLSEADEFKSKLDKAIQNCSIVVFSGSSPSPATDDIYPYGIKLADKYDKVSILDSYGRHLENCIKAGPTVIHNNVEEIESSLNISLKKDSEKFDFLNYLYSNNIKLSFITDGANPAYASKFDFTYIVHVPEISAADPTGSGDAFTAGLAFGMENSLIVSEIIKTSVALGTANAAAMEVCRVTREEMMRFYEKVRIEEIGKKMKLIDDSPTVK